MKTVREIAKQEFDEANKNGTYETISSAAWAIWKRAYDSAYYTFQRENKLIKSETVNNIQSNKLM